MAADEVKLVGLVEISAVRKAHPLAPGQYLSCIRGTNAQSKTQRTYAVFFKNDSYLSTRSPVIVDECEAQTFTLLGTGPFNVAAEKPKPG